MQFTRDSQLIEKNSSLWLQLGIKQAVTFATGKKNVSLSFHLMHLFACLESLAQKPRLIMEKNLYFSTSISHIFMKMFPCITIALFWKHTGEHAR